MASLACDYRMRAGDRALSRSAYKEAIAHFSAGLKSAEALAGSGRTDAPPTGFSVEARTGVDGGARVTRAPKSDGAYRRAAEIGEALGDAAAVFKRQMGPVA